MTATPDNGVAHGSLGLVRSGGAPSQGGADAAIVPSAVMDRVRRWSLEPERGPIEARLVHKTHLDNVLLSRLERAVTDRGDGHLAQMRVDVTHPFFFEHPIDHVPGLMLIEAGRQLATAIAHVELRVPFGAAFVLNGLNAQFLSFAELDAPTFIHSTILQTRMKRDQLVEMYTSSTFIQDETPIGVISGQLTVLSGVHALR